MGYAIKNIDKNQPEIVKAVRATSASVAHTHTLGKGFPDIVVGIDGLSLIGNFKKKEVLEALSDVKGLRILEGVNLMVEIKDDSKPPSKRKLTPDEVEWHEKWQGQIAIVENVRAAILLLASDQKHYEYMCLRAGILPESDNINWEALK